MKTAAFDENGDGRPDRRLTYAGADLVFDRDGAGRSRRLHEEGRGTEIAELANPEPRTPSPEHSYVPPHRLRHGRRARRFRRDVSRVREPPVRRGAAAGYRRPTSRICVAPPAISRKPRRRASIADEQARAEAVHAAHARVQHERARRRRDDKIWEAIESTPDFWTTLEPTDETIVRRISELSRRYRWEVFFITQRPWTEGETVQRQTQRWLVDQGFDLPSVLVISGSRGLAAKAIRLDYHVDDNAQNCFDIVADSEARPILLVPRSDTSSIAGARKLGIGIAHDVGTAVDILEQATEARENPGLLKRLATMVGWK